MNSSDTRQSEYTEITAKCGETVYVRLERDAVKAAEMISQFAQENCARSACRATQRRRCTCEATSGHYSMCATWDETEGRR